MDDAAKKLKQTTKVPVAVAESLIKTIRILAQTGRSHFKKYLFEPLYFAGWKVDYSVESSNRMMERMERASKSPSSIHTIAPHCKRMISRAITEGYSSVGNGAIFFLEKIAKHHQVSIAEESLLFVRIIQPPLETFQKLQNNRSTELFEESLKSFSNDQIKNAMAPVELGRQKIMVQVKDEARILFHRIKRANARQDLADCRKLISSYLIKYGDQEDNNRDEIEGLIEAFQRREPSFRKDIHDYMAINLYYQITRGITEGDLKKTIAAIRKYAFIFQGDPGTLYFQEIDRLESKLYAIIREKGLMDELKRDD